MKTNMVLIALMVMVASVAGADLTPGLRVKYKIGLRPGTDFFFDMPRTIPEATAAGWSKTPRAEGHLPSLALYCYSDLTVCALFDDTGYIAGLQIAFEKAKFVKNLFNMTVTGFKEWEVTDRSGHVRKFWTIAMYYVSEDYLKLPASERLEKRNSSKFLQEDAVWVTGFNGVVDKISGEDSEVTKSNFTRQSCTPWMGRHYYYDMRKDTECRDDTIYPWFVLTDSGKVMGIGLTVVGEYPVEAGSRDWFERPNILGVKIVIPNGSECFYDLSRNPGRTTMHVYFIDKPWTIFCPLW